MFVRIGFAFVLTAIALCMVAMTWTLVRQKKDYWLVLANLVWSGLIALMFSRSNIWWYVRDILICVLLFGVAGPVIDWATLTLKDLWMASRSRKYR